MFRRLELLFSHIKQQYIFIGLALAFAVSFGLYLNSATAATVNLVPSSTVSNAWPGGTAGCTTTTTGHTCIDEGSAVNTADYVGTGTSVAAVTANFEMGNQANVATATQLKLYMYAWSASIGGGTADTVTMEASVGGAPLGASSPISMTGTGTWYSITYNGTWTQAQVDNMQASFSRVVLGSGSGGTRDDDVRIASVYVEMTYTSPVNITQAAYRWLADDGGSGPAGTLASRQAYGTGSGPYAVATGDFNGDQITDLVAINNSSSTASILIGNGDGTFDPKVDYTTGAFPNAVAIGDFNGDQITDLVTTNSSASTASILIGNGDGTFDPKVDYTTGAFPSAVATGDFNGDQITDLVAINSSDDTASILIGNGDGTFDPRVDYATGGGPFSVKTGDFNGDQITDLVAINNSSSTASILIGNGDGTFDPKVDYATGANPLSVTTGDFNGDQITDLATTNNGAATASILIGNGDGTFDPKVDYATGANPLSVTTGDFNGDQITDLATTNNGAATASTLIGNGDGTFDPKVDYATGATPRGIATGDFNGDQITDLVVTNQSVNTLSVLLGNAVPPVTALAPKDSVASAPSAGVGFRLRLNLAITGDTLAVSTPFKLRYQQKSGTCSANPALYSDVTTSSPIRFFDKPSVASPGGYSASALDPTRSGITAVGQSYNEDNPFTVFASTPAGQDALWDFSLTTATELTPLTTYCVIATRSNDTALNAYPVIPEITIPDPTLEQSNYRFYQNANSLTPGAPLAAQNTKPTIPVNSAFRLRQLLRQTNDASSIGTPFKLQAGEKVSTCSVASFLTLSDGIGGGPVQTTGFQQTANTITGDADIFGNQWSNPSNAKLDDGILATHFFAIDSKGSASLNPSNYGFSLSGDATITGIEFQYQVGAAARQDVRFLQLKKGLTASENRTNLGALSPGATYTVGGLSDLWGLTWTPADINSPTFGVTFASSVTGTIGTMSLSIDYMALNVHYTVPGASSFIDNIGISDEATISSFANDPSPTSGAVVPQSYSENQNFGATDSIQNGENGLWDFALRADESLIGKTYCFRVVKDDGAPLASYAQYPEVTFTASGPTLSQQLRGGQSVVNGIKRPFNW